MTSLEAAEFANLLLVGFVFGTDVVTATVINPALNRLQFQAQLAAYKSLIRRFGFVMPWLLPLTLASGIVVVVKIGSGDSTPFALALAGVIALAVWELLAFALFPVNKLVWEADSDFPADRWRSLHTRWDRMHVLRTLCTVAAFVSFLLAVFLR